MPHPALAPLGQAIAALTYDQIEVTQADSGSTICGTAVPLLHRSIGQDLMRVESAMGGQGKTVFSAIAASIDEALIAIEEARGLLRGGSDHDA